MAALAVAGARTDAAELPRLGVRAGRFVVRSTGREFRPFGFQYIRIRGDGVHSVFAPSMYDAARAEAMLGDLERVGANVVRVFVGALESSDSAGLSPAFVANAADFLRRAARRGVYVLPVVDWIPHTASYDAIAARAPAGVGGMQALYLSPAHLEAKARYLGDFIAAIRQRGPALLDGVFAWELENEACWQMDAPPVGPGAGPFRWRGRSYDLRRPAEAQALMDASARRWAAELARAIRRADPGAMVGASVFTYAAVGRSGPAMTGVDRTADPRVPLRPLALAETPLSYMDVHLYAASPDGLARDLKSIEWEPLKAACQRAGKPLLVGEFGTFRAVHTTAADAACAMGWLLGRVLALGFSGAIYWTYDCDEQTPLWNAKSASGAIMRALTAARDASAPISPPVPRRSP